MPIDWTGCPYTERVPGRQSGAWTLVNSRMTADTIIDCYDMGEKPIEIAFQYQLRIDLVERVLRWALANTTLAEREALMNADFLET